MFIGHRTYFRSKSTSICIKLHFSYDTNAWSMAIYLQFVSRLIHLSLKRFIRAQLFFRFQYVYDIYFTDHDLDARHETRRRRKCDFNLQPRSVTTCAAALAAASYLHTAWDLRGVRELFVWWRFVNCGGRGDACRSWSAKERVACIRIADWLSDPNDSIRRLLLWKVDGAKDPRTRKNFLAGKYNEHFYCKIYIWPINT